MKNAAGKKLTPDDWGPLELEEVTMLPASKKKFMEGELSSLASSSFTMSMLLSFDDASEGKLLTAEVARFSMAVGVVAADEASPSSESKSSSGGQLNSFSSWLLTVVLLEEVETLSAGLKDEDTIAVADVVVVDVDKDGKVVLIARK